MTAVIQRVSSGSVNIDNEVYSEIGVGLLILLGVANSDTEDDVDILSRKIDGLRIFSDENGKMNLSVNDISGQILVVSNFTLYADVKKGKRPAFTEAAGADKAIKLYERFCENLKVTTSVKTGVFGADMKLEIVNDGPVTLVIKSEDLV